MKSVDLELNPLTESQGLTAVNHLKCMSVTQIENDIKFHFMIRNVDVCPLQNK